jgi:hypothetical protein
MYLKLIRQANLDAMSGRAITTMTAHAAATKRLVRRCALIGKTPTIPPRRPLPMSDLVGMSVAVDMLFHLLTANPRLEGESHIQLNSMCRVQSTCMRMWESSPQVITEGSAFSSGFGQTRFMTWLLSKKDSLSSYAGQRFAWDMPPRPIVPSVHEP